MYRGTSTNKGFTLIELACVVCVIAILAAVTLPQFRASLGKATEGTTKANLGAIRAALSVYYSDTQGTYPTSLDVLTLDNKYINKIPPATIPSNI